MKIKDVEKRTGITSYNIRFYEKENLLIIPGLSEPPVRTLRATIPGNESQLKFLILDD
ncbi:MerR family regulatory protein [uncultured Blautia sp.]|uniref:MerR family DNA-binding transcriptional regulator n=1 Tax=Blautia acetigignens TaxID=2981783 RepID=A0ABV1CJS2_9FIRM|nr:MULTISPECIES: MerR family DNA-binding transcriptional regulator [Blautia]MCU6775592.1 MerR family DNA-binding transcriptional regulator [Blautia acetigignens]NSL05952.1 MerR family DNA-binding transcriptional regulator [Blautia glucerasea]SCH84064.1 MerR family regulatory protein [uncultured Blautia sp.]